MNREKQLMKNTAIITISKVCTQMVSFFLLPLYTALLSTTEFGIVDLLNTIVALIVPMLTLQIDQAIFRFLIDARDSDEKKTKLISSSNILLVFEILLYAVIFVVFSGFVSNEYKYFLGTNVIAAMVSSLYLQIARGLGKTKEYSVGSFIAAATNVVLNVIFVAVLQLGASGMLLAVLISNIITSVYLLFAVKIYKHIKVKSWDKSLIKELCKYSFPLIPNAVSWWIINVSDRAVVSSVISVAANGIYSAANKFSGMYINAYNIFNIAWTESATVHIDDKDKDEFFSKIINTAFKIFACFAIVIISLTPIIFNVLINTKFNEAYYQVPILMLSSLLNVGSGLVSVIYVAKKRSKEIAKTSFFAAAINLVVNLLLIKKIGLYAASISTLVAYLVMMIYRFIDCRKYVKVKLDIKMLSMLFMMFIVLFVTFYLNITYLNWAIFVISIVFTIVINKNSLKTIQGVIKNKFKIKK